MNLKNFSHSALLKRRKILRKEAQKFGKEFVEIKFEVTTPYTATGFPLRAWRNRRLLVQYYEDKGHRRISVNRADVDVKARSWTDGITWDELQEAKEKTVGDVWAVEIYPPADRLVNVANIRHLWLLDGPPPFAWGAEGTP